MKLAWLAIALAACGGRNPESCKADAEDIAKRLAEADHDPNLISTQGANLVERSDLAKPDFKDGPVLRLSSDAIVLEGSKVAIDDLTTSLRARRRKMDDDLERHPRFKAEVDVHMIYLFVDAGATWGQVVRVVNAVAAADFTSPWFVFARPSHARRPPPSKVDAELEAIAHGDAANKATKLANMMSATIAGCPAMISAFGGVASHESGSKADQLIAAIPAALVDCNCNVDMPSFASEMWSALVNEHPAGVLAVQIDPSGAPIELPAITSWRDASKQLTPATKTVSLRAVK
jgi:hypothetical protein